MKWSHTSVTLFIAVDKVFHHLISNILTNKIVFFYEMDQVLNRGYEIKYAIIRAIMKAILAISYRKEAEKFRTSTRFEPVTSQFRYDVLTN